MADCISDLSGELYGGSHEKLESLGFVLPDTVQLEASTLCQLRCRTCLIQRDHLVTLGKGYLRFEDFKNFVIRHPFIKSIELSNNGEIFLNPELIEIIAYAFGRNIRLSANGGVNFNTVSDKMIETLVKYKFHSMKIAIDGASDEVYSSYRINGNFKQVIGNIKKLNEQKMLLNSEFPKLRWQYVIMAGNESDVVKAKQLAKQLDMDILFKRSWDKDQKLINVEMLRAETGLNDLTREEYERNNPKAASQYLPCSQLWWAPTINWDGCLLGCCCSFKSDFGVNVFEVGLKKALSSSNYKYAKRMLQGELPPPENDMSIPCVNCTHYKTMLERTAFTAFMPKSIDSCQSQ